MAIKKTSYQNLNNELNEILDLLQTTDLDVDEALKAYERGMAIAQELESYLKTAETTIKKIKTNSF